MDDSFLIEATEAHFAAIINKDVEPILNSYSRSEDLLVFVEGPRWATLGYENVARGWRDFISSDIALKSCVWVENLQSKIIGEMGFVGGIVELQVQIKDKSLTIRFRGTFVFEKSADGEWRIVHEHFSQPAADPYGIGDWLKSEPPAVAGG